MDESHSNNKHFPCKLLKILCEDDKGPNQGNLSLTSLFIFFHYFYLYWNSYSVFWTSSFFFFFFCNGFCRLTHLNKITKNDFMLYNPPGGHSYWLHQGAKRHLWSNTVRGSSILTQLLLHALRTHLSTCSADIWKSCMDLKWVLSPVRYFNEVQMLKCLLNTNTVKYIRHCHCNTTSEKWTQDE